MENNKFQPIKQIISVIIGEAIVSAIIALVFLLIGKYDYKVLLGAMLGSLVIILNYVFLVVLTTRAIDDIIAKRGTAELSEEEIESFTKENTARLQNTVKLSYIIRTLCMIAALVVALVSKQFNLIATVIPLLMLRPILYIKELLFRKRG